MKERSYTNSIDLEIEIDEKTGALKSITVRAIDQDVFPPLAVEDKQKMAWVVDSLSAGVKNAIADPRVHARKSGAPVRQEGSKTYTCTHCGKEFPVKRPCGGCGKETTTEICPACHTPVRITWE